MWSDNETTDDLFGFRVHADLIRELIIDPTVLPATIGVYGDWGGGKSSIMQMLRDDFEKGSEESGVAVLYFNGWLFEGYDDAKSALLSSILTSLRDHKRFGPKIKDTAISLLKRVDYMRGMRILFSGALVGGIGAATGGVGLAAMLPLLATGALTGAKEAGADAAKEAVGNGSEKVDEALSDIRQFRDDFAKMIAKSDIKTLVILIDDLDRCSPERIIDNLEAIKLFLNVPNTAFVIGADRRIIRQAVAWRYRDAIKPEGSEEQSDRLVDDYLEKLIQIPYRLPRLSPSEIETYLTLLFCKRYLGKDPFLTICGAAREQRNKDRYSTFGQTQALEVLKTSSCPPKLQEALQIGASISSQITDVLQGNPRQVKRFLNAFFLRRKLADVAKLSEVKDDVLVKLMLLEYAAPKLFEKLFTEMNGESGLAPFLVGLEPKSAGASPKGISAQDELPPDWKPKERWLAMEPRLAEVDLRDYMWVTRDRLGSTMSNATMVPPAVRKVLKLVLSEMGQKTGFVEMKKLNPEERAILSRQLVVQAQRAPGEIKPFRALAELTNTDPSVAEDFHALVARLNKDTLAPALGVLVLSASKDSTPFGLICLRIVSELGDDKTRFGKALKQKPR